MFEAYDRIITTRKGEGMKIQQTSLHQKHQQNFGLRVTTIVQSRQNKELARQGTIRKFNGLIQYLPEELKAALYFAMKQAGDARLYARHTKDGKLFLSPNFYYRRKTSIDISNIRSQRKAKEAGTSLFAMIRKHLTKARIRKDSPNLSSEMTFV